MRTIWVVVLRRCLRGGSGRWERERKTEARQDHRGGLVPTVDPRGQPVPLCPGEVDARHPRHQARMRLW